jgi:D-alanine-D-alanine ligase
VEKRIKVGVIFGGRSPEHEVSLVSAASVIRALDPKKYEILPIGITPEGRWLASTDALKLLKEKTSVERYPEHTIVPNPRHHGLLSLNRSLTNPALYHVDVLFPVLHGVFGEDGTIQGLFELAGIPYVGAGVLGSAIGMDKVIQKQLLREDGIPVTADLWFTSDEFNKNRKKLLASAARSIRFPAFVKPANLGSSIGISKVRNVKELEVAIDLASTYDRKILVEKAVPRAREIECSVLGNDDPSASLPGEVVPSNEFYDYDAKYVDGKSKAIVPAKLPKSVIRKIRDLSVRAFRILDCAGMARVDFLVPAGTTRVFLNEINTIPGFTSISMYPKLWEASGLSYPDLLDRLIQLALERHETRSRLQTTYRPKTGWYKE